MDLGARGGGRQARPLPLAPCTFVPAAAPHYKFFSELSREGLEVETADVEGEVTVLAKVTRKIEKGSPETVGQPVPGVQLNRRQRRKGGTSTPLTVRLSIPMPS